MDSKKKILINDLQKDWKKYWQVELFKEKGFKRNRCKCCNKFFWSLTDQDICGDSSCVEYSFLSKPPAKKKLDYIETWKAIEKFFVKNGHESIDRYPVICRWYPLFFTIAGIVDFYRIADSKITFEFPANPLILSQPCLRFNDIPNVGVTGRHYSCFNMIQQSSLWDGKKGYWKDRCIDLDFRLLTEAFGIKEDEITFMEDAWVGHGAFGYSLEYFVRGLETGNAVFTEFEGTLENYRPMKDKVIDMGAGQERLCWLTQGTPTSYDAVFGPVIEKMIKKSGVNYDKQFLMNYNRHAGCLDMNEVVDAKKEMEKVAKILKVPAEEMIKNIEPMLMLYAVADHSKALLYSLSDGGLPSNVGGGYNLRVVLRRAINFLNKLGNPFEIEWVIEEHAKYLKDMHPELAKNLDHINEIVGIEKKKYDDTKKRMKGTLEVLSKESSLSEEKLVELYDSHGVTPEIINEFAEKNKIKISIPEDFYSKVTERHLEEKKEAEKEVAYDLPKTEKLYYEDEKKYEFDAKVLKVDSENIMLDKTLFYPRGGGQEPDHGEIDGFRVYDVEIEGGIIVHKVENHKLKEGQKVHGVIDAKRRQQIMKHHTATHLVNMSARELLGKHVWQAGSKKNIDKAHLDITHYENLSEDQVAKLGDYINKMIKKKVNVKKEVLPRSEAEKKYGFVIYQGGSIPQTTLRIISIAGLDSEACGGLHVDNTEEVEEIFIFNTKRIQDGVIRIEFVAGRDLVKMTRKRLEKEKRKAEENLKKKEKDIQKQKDKIRKIKRTTEKLLGVNYVDTEDMKEAETIAKESVKDDPSSFSVIIGNGVVFGTRGEKSKDDIEAIVKEAAKIMGGSAGGRGNEFRGGGPLKDNGKQAAKKLKI